MPTTSTPPHGHFIAKNQLAMLYFPGDTPRTASVHLMRWIRRNAALVRALEETGYRPRDKYFSPMQVGIIYQYLGEP